MVSHSRIINSFSASLRMRRFQQFADLLSVDQNSKILDVGGTPGFWINSGLEKNVTILNLNLPEVCPPPFTWVEGDACQMSGFTNHSFDIVFSNSVIEHVGDMDRQKQMASEIRRIGKRYWVQTPYKHFPVELHFVFPFFQYLPKQLQRKIASIWPFSFAKFQGRDPLLDVETIWLLDIRQMKALFPESHLVYERFAGLIKSLLIYKI